MCLLLLMPLVYLTILFLDKILFCTGGGVLEKIVREQMLKYLIRNNIFRKNQHDFIGKKSTVTNLIECFNTWTEYYDKGIQTDVIYLDFSKCLDTVIHSKLMFKISKYGFDGSAYNCIKKFLVDRKQYVKLDAELPHETIASSGVPQGTVLCPLLFQCFSADINRSIDDSVLSMYADDTKLFKGIQHLGDCMNLQNDLYEISLWADSWQLTLNSANTKHFRIGRHREDYTFYLNGCVIEQVNSMCDIFVFVQSDLKFTTHCNNLVKRAHFCMRNIFTLSKGMIGILYFFCTVQCTYMYICVRPILEYVTQAWSP